MNQTTPSRRGFAGMDPDFQKRVASAGGRAAHAKGTAHQFSSEEARAAGRKGGATRAARRKAAVDVDPISLGANQPAQDPMPVAIDDLADNGGGSSCEPAAA